MTVYILVLLATLTWSFKRKIILHWWEIMTYLVTLGLLLLILLSYFGGLFSNLWSLDNRTESIIILSFFAIMFLISNVLYGYYYWFTLKPRLKNEPLLQLKLDSPFKLKNEGK
jgi:hypothetical protein